MTLFAAAPTGERVGEKVAERARGPAGGAALRLEFASSPALQRVADRLQSWRPQRLNRFCQLIGVDLGGQRPIRVVLLDPDQARALEIGPWVAGFARADLDTVVLIPGRVPIYPHANLEELLGHEIAHVLIARSAAGRPLPRWWQEGLAMLAEESWGLKDRGLVARTLIRRGRYDLADLDRRFGDPRQVRGAYALAGSFVRALVRDRGRLLPARLLRRVALGESFEEAFREAAGYDLATAEERFWRRMTVWYRWLPVLSSEATLWAAMALLVLVAVLRRRRRDRSIYERWELEESLAGRELEHGELEGEEGWPRSSDPGAPPARRPGGGRLDP